VTTWWHSDQERLKLEKDAIAALEAKADWLENIAWDLDNEFRLIAVFDIVLAHARFSLRITYHNTFPSSPPGIAPIADIKLSGHQYGAGGDLCLQIRPDNWRPEYTGADMIKSAQQLLSDEAPDSDGAVQAAPSDHDLPDTIRFRGAVFRFYIPAVSRLFLGLMKTGVTPVKLKAHWCGDDFVVVQMRSIQLDGEDVPLPDLPLALGREGFSSDGAIIRTETDVAGFSGTTETAFADYFGIPSPFSEASPYALIIGQTGTILLFRRSFGDDGALIAHQTILQPTERARSGDQYADLKDTQVGIVGLGSLGAKIATSLARAGVGRFELVDSDILHAGNLERHDADWRDIGLHKADLVARRVRLVRAGVKAHAWRSALGVQVSTREAGNVHAALDSCDVVIDATANPEAFNNLAGLIQRSNSTLIWGGVYAGGVGGEIARSRPLKDPSPFDVRDAVAAFHAQAAEPVPLPLGAGYDGQDGDTVWSATDADVAAIAAAMTAMALDALIEREPSRYDAHAYLLGLERAYIFKAPFHAQPIVADAPLRTNLSPPGEAGVEKDFVNTLIKKKLDDIKNTTKDD